MRKTVWLLTALFLLCAALSAPALAAEPGYSVQIGPDQTCAVGQTATVTVSVSTQDVDHFNTLDMTLHYDAERLTLVSGTPEGMELTDSEGAVRVLCFGPDRPIGTAFSLQFQVLKPGQTEVKLLAANVSESEKAITDDIPSATITVDKAVISGKEVYDVDVEGSGEDDVIAAPGAVAGEDYVFSIDEEEGMEYSVQAFVNGEEVPVLGPDEDGNYIIEGEYVTGPVTIIVTATPKSGPPVGPVTGDNGNLRLWVGIGVGSALLLMALLVIVRKRRMAREV